MNLVTNPPLPLPMFAVTPEAEERRNVLAESASTIRAVTTAAENLAARNVAVEIRTYLKDVEAIRTQLTRPLRDATALLKTVADDHVAPLAAELERLERIATAFAVAERTRAEAEEKARLDLAAEAKTEEQFQAVMAEPTAAARVARGQQLRKVLRWEVTDIAALVKARPDLCKIEPKGSAIQAVCIPEMPNLPPGLKLWWEEKTVFTTR
jgi:hypothetical protein